MIAAFPFKKTLTKYKKLEKNIFEIFFNIFCFVVLYYFDILMLNIKKIFFNILLNKKKLKNNYYYNFKHFNTFYTRLQFNAKTYTPPVIYIKEKRHKLTSTSKI
jgi:hypothetical protein